MMPKFLTILLMLSTPTFAFAEDALNDGRLLYAYNCASCHGANLEGQENWRTPNDDSILPAPPHDETGHTWHHDDDLLFSYTKLGGAELLKQRGMPGFASGMPGFKDILTDAEIVTVLEYIKSTWPKEIQEAQSERSRNKDQ